MHAKTLPNRVLSLFLILAMLITLFAALLPVAVSAGDPEPEEIQDFGYQSSAERSPTTARPVLNGSSTIS